MDIEKQISLCNNPQEFTRLCNVILQAEFTNNFRALSDDRADGGNDGYIISEKRIIARHCFKQIPKQKIDSEIIKKAKADLLKIIELKKNNKYQIKKWTFLTNYYISESVYKVLNEISKENGLIFNQLGPNYIAGLVLKYKYLMSEFAWLKLSKIEEDIEEIKKLLNKEINTKNEKQKTKPDLEQKSEPLPKFNEKEHPDFIKAKKIIETDCSEDNKSLLKTLLYTSGDIWAQLQCVFGLINCYNPLKDKAEDMIVYCDLGINLSKILKNSANEAVLLAEKASFLSEQFGWEDMTTAIQVESSNYLGISTITESERQNKLKKILELDKQFKLCFKEALEKAKESNNRQVLARIALKIASAAGLRYIHLSKFGVYDRAEIEKKLCKVSYFAAKNIYISLNDKQGLAYTLHDLANDLRFFGEEKEALLILKQVMEYAKELGDKRLLTKSQILEKRIKSGEIPNYINGNVELED